LTQTGSEKNEHIVELFQPLERILCITDHKDHHFFPQYFCKVGVLSDACRETGWCRVWVVQVLREEDYVAPFRIRNDNERGVVYEQRKNVILVYGMSGPIGEKRRSHSCNAIFFFK
jgi:hypothetical protein